MPQLKHLKTVIIADDTEHIRNYIKALLADLGVHIICCANGKELFKLLHQQNIFLDLVILDLSMPEVNGLVALQQMATIKKIKRFKVCVVSGHQDKRVIDKALEFGIEDFIIKPFDEETFVNRIKKILNFQDA